MFDNIVRVLKIKVGSPTKLGNDEIRGIEGAEADARAFKKHGGTRSVSWRHGDDRPSGDIFTKVCGNLMLSQEVNESVKVPSDFPIHIVGHTIDVAIGLQGKSSNDQQVNCCARLLRIGLEQRDEPLNRDRRQIAVPPQRFDTHVNRQGRSRSGVAF